MKWQNLRCTKCASSIFGKLQSETNFFNIFLFSSVRAKRGNYTTQHHCCKGRKHYWHYKLLPAVSFFRFCFQHILSGVYYKNHYAFRLRSLFNAKVKLICLFRKLSTPSVRKGNFKHLTIFAVFRREKPSLKMIRGVCTCAGVF